MRVPVLEVGGTHVTAALVDPESWTVRSTLRRDVDADAPAGEVLAAFVAAGDSLDAPGGARWGVAMPDPFDYPRGVAQFGGFDKFRALHGLDVGAALADGLAARPDSVSFVNDADAFTLGEWLAGAARGARRCTGLTLGTGIGTGWVVDGAVVDPGTPPDGRLHRLSIDGRPVEDVVSRRAIRAAWVRTGGDPAWDVREIASAARAGDRPAIDVLAAAFTALGGVLAPCLAAFEADVVVVGGSMSASWDLLDPWVRACAGHELPEIRVAADPPGAPLIGAAAHALR